MAFKNQDAHEISSYEDACRLRSLETESAEMKEQFRSIYSLFRRYALYGTLVTPVREPLFRQDTYSQLSPYFQNILDIYKKDSIGRGLKPGTYRSSISACSTFSSTARKKDVNHWKISQRIWFCPISAMNLENQL
ncbi:MAG: hypothetical protein ACLT8Y_16380 [Dorea formicigenerans]